MNGKALYLLFIDVVSCSGSAADVKAIVFVVLDNGR